MGNATGRTELGMPVKRKDDARSVRLTLGTFSTLKSAGVLVVSAEKLSESSSVSFELELVKKELALQNSRIEELQRELSDVSGRSAKTAADVAMLEKEMIELEGAMEGRRRHEKAMQEFSSKKWEINCYFIER